MSATKDKAGSVTTTSAAQNRFTMSMVERVGADLDRLGARMSKAVADLHGVTIELSRPQVVESLVKAELARLAERDAQANSNGENAS